jgi:hypothetical protein
MAASSRRWERVRVRLSTAICRHALDSATPGVAKIPGNLGELGGQQLAPRNDHEIDRCSGSLRSELTEHLSNQSLRPIPLDRAAKLPRGDDPEPGRRQPVRKQQEREEPAVQTSAAIEYGPEVATPPNPPVFGECGRGRLRRARFRGGISRGVAIVRDGPVRDAGLALSCAPARRCRQSPRSSQEPPRAGLKTMKRTGACALLRGVV